MLSSSIIDIFGLISISASVVLGFIAFQSFGDHDDNLGSGSISGHSDIRRIQLGAPFPMWHMREGELIWHNHAFEDMMRNWPEEADIRDVALMLEAKYTNDVVPHIQIGDENPKWYELTRSRIDTNWVYCAQDISDSKNSDISRRNFIQTLAKTFADLSIGLAIFDSSRNLVLFNPALIDLTDLPAGFLISKPDMMSVFDRLRDNRVMPEPKDYTSWRSQIAALTRDAEQGTYIENWALHNGSNYRVIGRPHPDGTIAFLFEDITAEISLTRKFRAELDQNQMVLDSLQQAVAVFSADGFLMSANQRCEKKWGLDVRSGFEELSITAAIDLWKSHFLPCEFWKRLQEFSQTISVRTPISANLITTSGCQIEVTATPLENRSMVISFTQLKPAQNQSKAFSA